MEPPGQMEHWKCTQERQISANLARLPPGKARTPQMHSKATVAKCRAQLMVCFLQVWQPSLTPCHCTPLISAVHSSSPSLGSKFSMEFQWQHSASTTRTLPTPQTVLTMSVTKTMSQVEFRLVTIVDIFLTFLKYGLHNIWVMLKCLTAVLEFYYFIKEFKKEKENHCEACLGNI